MGDWVRKGETGTAASLRNSVFVKPVFGKPTIILVSRPIPATNYAVTFMSVRLSANG